MDGEDRSTAELLRDGFRWFADDVETRSAAAGEAELTPGAAMTMAYLDESPVQPSELARRMQVSRQRIHAVVRELSAAGLVEQRSHPDSARDKLIHLTAAGARRRQQVAAALRALDLHAAKHLGDADLHQLRRILVRLVAIPRVQGQADE